MWVTASPKQRILACLFYKVGINQSNNDHKSFLALPGLMPRFGMLNCASNKE